MLNLNLKRSQVLKERKQRRNFEKMFPKILRIVEMFLNW